MAGGKKRRGEKEWEEEKKGERKEERKGKEEEEINASKPCNFRVVGQSSNC